MKLNATQKMGEISVALPVAELKGPGAVLPNGGKYKRDVLAEAGVSTSTLGAPSQHRANHLFPRF